MALAGAPAGRSSGIVVGVGAHLPARRFVRTGGRYLGAVDEQPAGASGDDADPARTGPEEPEGGPPSTIENESPASEIIDLPWDDDLPVALGEETDLSSEGQADGDTEASPAADADGVSHEGADPDGGGDEFDYPAEDEVDDGQGGRRARPRRVDTWRTRTATGAIASAIAMGLQQVFEPEQRRPAAVAEAPSDPYDEDDPITVDYVPDDAGATTVHVKPWLLQKDDHT
jgi:hypothetical protein